MSEINLKRRPFMLGAGAAAVGVASTAVMAQSRAPSGLSAPVTGVNSQGEFVYGTFSPSSAVVRDGAVFVEGLLRMAEGGAQRVLMPVATNQSAQIAQVCTILDLILGPLDLNLLGLRVQLNQIHLVITANPQDGLLGQLLCAIANLLSGPLTTLQALQDLANSLNRLLGLFR